MEYTKIKDGKIFGKLMEMIEVLVIPEGYENIQNEVFAGYYTNLKKIICPTTLTNAGYRCFSCSDAKEFILNNGLQSIGDEAFQGSQQVEEIIIPSSVVSIGKNAFRGCYSLKKIIINKEKNSIEGAPWGADNIEIIWNNTNNIDNWDNLL